VTTFPTSRTAERRLRGAQPKLPAFGAVLREQIRATGLALRAAGVAGAVIVGLITLVVILQSVGRGAAANAEPWPTVLPGLMGMLLPGAVWARDDRFGPGFLWTLPVDRRRQALTKVLAGWVWLMAGVALFALWTLAMALVSGAGVLPPEALRVLTAPFAPGVPLDPSTLRSATWAPGLLIWVVPFTGATATYLLASAVVLGTRRSLRWVIGVVLFYALLAVASDAASAQLSAGWLADAPGRLLRRIVENPYGFDALLTARTQTLSTTAPLSTGETVLVWRAVPTLADWAVATLIWTAGGVIALWAAASRHRERRRA
jgi:hypothetical protein